MGGATQGEKAALVKELREEGYTLKYLLATMELSKSTYYYEIRKTDKVQERNADISSKVESIFQENKGRYGVRRVCQELARRGFPVNHKRVQRIMNRLGADRKASQGEIPFLQRRSGQGSRQYHQQGLQHRQTPAKMDN